MVVTGLTDALTFLPEKQVTVRSGSLSYIRPHPELFDTAEVREKLPTL
jgi:hypothetical protein